MKETLGLKITISTSRNIESHGKNWCFLPHFRKPNPFPNHYSGTHKNRLNDVSFKLHSQWWTIWNPLGRRSALISTTSKRPHIRTWPSAGKCTTRPTPTTTTRHLKLWLKTKAIQYRVAQRQSSSTVFSIFWGPKFNNEYDLQLDTRKDLNWRQQDGILSE